LLNNPKKDDDEINFAQFQLMYGDPDGNIEKDYENFMKFQMHRQNADIRDVEANAAAAVGRSKNINSNTDFTKAGGANANTKHVPYADRKGGR